MVADISVMVLPPAGGIEEEGKPRFYVFQQGVWRDFSEAGALSMGLGQSQSIVQGTLSDVMGQVVVDRKDGGAVSDRYYCLRQKLGSFYENVVPRELRRLLNEAADQGDGDDRPILRIHAHSQVDRMPWEIMHDRADFLGLRFQIVRLPIVHGGPDLDELQTHPVHRIYSLLGKNLVPTGSESFETWRTTFTRLVADGESVQYPSGDGAHNDWPSVEKMEEAAGQADIVHVTCHAGLKGGAVWTLDDKAHLSSEHDITVDVIRWLSFEPTKPLVFGNACASAGGEDLGGGAITFGEAFFSKGVLAFVGTLAPVTYHLAVDFASQFYRRLLSGGLPIGKALWATKRHYHDAQENDPSWLFYCLYGLPDTSFSLPNG